MTRHEKLVAEIERLTLHTTEKAPFELFVELGQIEKLPKIWKYGGIAFGALAAIVSFFAFGDRMDTLPPFGSGGGASLYATYIGLALFAAAALIGRWNIDARFLRWVDKAERVIQARGSSV